jgi:hypothetical protein
MRRRTAIISEQLASLFIKSSILPACWERHRVGFFAVDAPRKANADQRGIDRIGIGEETFAWGNFVH